MLLPHTKLSTSQKQLLSNADIDFEVKAEDEDGTGTQSKKYEGGLDGVAVEAKCPTSHQSSSDSRGNKDLLGMMNEELEHETELLYEE